MNETLRKPETAYSFSGQQPGIFAGVLRDCYRGSGWLTVTGFLMALDTVISLVGLAVDHTTVMGDPTWLKPLKFGISTTLFNLTLAYMIGHFQAGRRFAAWLGRVIAVAIVLEIVLIDMQAARHTSSHFNVANPFDQQVFAIMGIAIAVLYLSTALLCFIAFAVKFPDRPLGWAIRLSLVLALAGMGSGVLMTLPTPEQKALLHAGGGLPRSGAHTVGAPDGGSSIPLTGWSADHGDLRIAHFVGLHAMQLILLAWWLRRRAKSTQIDQSELTQIWLVFAVSVSIANVYAIVLVQALHGQPFLRPSGQVLTSWIAWALGSGVLLLWISTLSRRQTSLHTENR